VSIRLSFCRRVIAPGSQAVWRNADDDGAMMMIVRAQGKRVKAIIFAMYTTTNDQEPDILRRPWYIWWFMGQIFR